MQASAKQLRRANAGHGTVLWLAAFVPFLICGFASAQATTDSLALADSAAIRLAPIVVTAARVPVRADRVGFSVSVLSAAELRSGHARNAADALRNVDGTFVDEANGPGGPTIVRLRGGEEVFTQILMDGVRINQNGGYFDFQGFAPANLSRIEIARGPQSALYGSSAVSGVVHFITRGGMVGAPRIGVNVEGSGASENGGGFRADAAVSGGTDQVRYSGGLGWTFDRGIYELPNDAKTRDASLRLDLLPAGRITFSSSFRYIGVDAKLPVRDPGATRVPLDPNALSTRDRFVGSVAARFDASPAWRHELRGTFYRENFVYDDVRDDVAESTEYPFFVFDATFRLDSRLRRRGLEYSGSWSQRDAAGLVVSWGALRETETLDDVTTGEFGDNEQELDRSSNAGFAEVMLSPASWLDFLVGGRIEKFDGLDAAATPRASAVVRVVPRRLSFRLAAGRAYKAPNLQEQYLDNPFILSNPDLAPETSTSVEAGIDASTANGVLSGSLTAFRQSYDDLIRAVAIDTTGRQQNRNLGSSRAVGVEWRLEYRPRARWSAGTSGAWVRTRILDATGLPQETFPQGEELPFRPAALGAAWVEVSPVNRFTARLRGSWVGSQTVLTERFSGQRDRLDGYLIAGITANYAIDARWSAYGRIDNLFGTNYQTGFDRRGIPATAAIGVRWEN